MRNIIRKSLALSLGLLAGCGEGADTRDVDQSQRARLLAEVQKLNLAPGGHDNLQLVVPGADGKEVSCAVNAVIRDGGRIVVLVKTVIEPKGNYHGYVFSNQPIPAAEIGVDAYGRQEILTQGIAASPPVIETRLDAATFKVFFDLG